MSEPVHPERALPQPGGSVYSLSEVETYELGRALGRRLEGGELIVLEGPLGIGKTVFARGVAAGLGVDPDEISSPSFTLVQEHGGARLRMYHADLYRIESQADLETLGLEDLILPGNVLVVEWGERLPPSYRQRAVTVRLHDIGEAARKIELFASAETPLAHPEDH